LNPVKHITDCQCQRTLGYPPASWDLGRSTAEVGDPCPALVWFWLVLVACAYLHL